MAYVKEHHTTGVTWNPRGVTVAEYQAGGGAAAAAASAAAATTTGAAPAATPSPAAAAKPAGALFAELNKGGAITSGLKTVTKDMQTWRAEYKAGVAAPAAPAAPAAAPSSTAGKRVAETVKGPPKLEFNGAQHKWVVENQTADAGVLKVSTKSVHMLVGMLLASVHSLDRVSSGY